MLIFVVKRLAQLPLVMLALTLLIVGLLQFLSPEERAQAYVTSEAQTRNLEVIIREHGLDQPFLVQYGHWMADALHGDLGFSRASNRPVTETIRERLPATIELALVSAIPIIGVGVWLGMLAALHRNDLLDRSLRLLAIVGFSLPTFVMGILLLVVFYGALGWFPGNGNLSVVQQLNLTDPAYHRYSGLILVDSLLNGRPAMFLDALHHLALPALTLIITSGAVILKVMRAQVLETLRADHVRTARAKGLAAQVVNARHVRRNALLPIVTFAGFTVIGLLGGVLFTETIFGYPGIGEWGGQAALRFDVPGVIGFALLNAVIVVVVSTVSDLLYGVVDPRVRVG
ncbi:ABC transporter permease (plasmid) [Deinococcus sp. D7000]|nr:ABC transporter permease [Deinococcus sp. D7000]